MAASDRTDGYVRELIGQSYPSAEVYAHDSRRLRRRWVVRVHGNLGEEEAGLIAEATAIADSIRKLLRERFQHQVTDAELDFAVPGLRLVRIDTRHLIVDIDFPAPGAAIGDEALYADWGVLQEIDRRWR